MTSPYDGRTVDVLVFRGPVPSGDALRAQDVLADGGQVCTGIVKLAQWFVTELFKQQGSMPFDSQSGTTFLHTLTSGRLRTETDVFVAFGFAVGTVASQAARAETTTTPTDEQFAGAVLGNVALAPGSVKLSVILTSRAGTTRTLILPIPLPRS